MGTRFKDESKSMYSIPQRFADVNLKRCPICGAYPSKWLVASEQKLFFKYYKFKCIQCESILRISEADITGLSYTNKSFSGLYKQQKGKEGKKIYVLIEKVGVIIKNSNLRALRGEEFTLDELFSTDINHRNND